jgi:hypothetical protein
MDGFCKLPGVRVRVDAALVRLESLFQCAEESGGRKSSSITSD